MTTERRRRRRPRGLKERWDNLPEGAQLAAIGAAATGGAGATVLVINSIIGGGQAETVPFTPIVPEPETASGVVITPTLAPTATATHEATTTPDNEDCVMFNNPRWDSYDPTYEHENVPNAITAVRLLGDPPPPYTHVDNGGIRTLITDISQLDRNKGGKTVYNGEQVCVNISEDVAALLREYRSRTRQETKQEVMVSSNTAKDYELRARRS